MNERSIIDFNSAVKLSQNKAFSTLIKPIGGTCNMRCNYCYYIDKSKLYGGKTPIMSKELLKEYIAQYIEGNDVDKITFCWHGGEPLIAGLEFYEEAIKYQKRYAKGKTIENTIQTNGLLVDDNWSRFFNKNNFLVGISIDGPQDIHNRYRNNSYDKVIKAINSFQQHGVEFNTLSVISNLSHDRGVEIYQFLKSIGSRFIQLLPAVEFQDNDNIILQPAESSKGRLAPTSVDPIKFGEFMISIFDYWVKNDVGNYFVQMFDATLANWYGVKPGLCSFAKSCGDGMVVEHNGDVYSCDHFVYPEFKLGNILEDDLRTIYNSKKQFNFGIDKRKGLSEKCLRCKYYFACTGGCPKHRFASSAGTNYLCDGYLMFFEHVEPYMKRFCELLHSNREPALIMRELK